MKNQMGARKAGCALLCLMLAGASVEMLPEAELTKEKTPLLEKGQYTLWQGLVEDDPYSLPLETIEENGYMVMAEGSDAARCDDVCISVRETVGSYLPVEGDLQLRAEVLYALCDMQFDHSLHEGVAFIRGYVSKAEQDAWQQEAVERHRLVHLPLTMARQKVPSGGKGEHQLGLCVDVRLRGKLNMREKDPLKRNADGLWLYENMWQYGFVYDGDFAACEDIHLRYVGKTHALMMHLLQMNLEEYLAFLQEQKTVTLMRGQDIIACVQCVTEEETDIWAPQGMRRDMSRDNRGNLIIAFRAE